MRADYDSEADALDIEMSSVERWEGQESVDDTYCQVGFAGGRPASIELLNPADQLGLLDVAAERYELDAVALKVVAQAALAAPDQVIELDISASIAA